MKYKRNTATLNNLVLYCTVFRTRHHNIWSAEHYVKNIKIIYLFCQKNLLKKLLKRILVDESNFDNRTIIRTFCRSSVNIGSKLLEDFYHQFLVSCFSWFLGSSLWRIPHFSSDNILNTSSWRKTNALCKTPHQIKWYIKDTVELALSSAWHGSCR